MTSGRARFFLILTNVISIGLLIWVLRGADFDILWEEVKQMKWQWVVVASVADISVYVLQGWRWSILLKPVSHIPIMQSVRAIYVGLFANEVLPLRSGEIIRCYLQSRWGNLPLSVTLSSALIERVFDGLWLVLYLAVVIQFVDLPKGVQNGGYALMLVVAVLAAVLAWVMFYKGQAKAAVSGSRWAKHLHVLFEDLHAIGSSRSFYYAWMASLPHMLSMMLPIYAVMRAVGLEGMGLMEAAIVNVIVRLGTVIPNAPGNLGTYQALVVLSLSLMGIDAPQAKRFSIVLWGIVTAPLLLAGFVALSVTGFRLKELQKQAENEHRAQKHGAD